MDVYGTFERDGINSRNLEPLMEMYGALKRHDPEFDISNFMSVETISDFTEPMEEPEIESLLPADLPVGLHCEAMGEP